MEEHEKSINEVIRNLRNAADQLENRVLTPEEAESTMSDLQSCCSTCTFLSHVPPCGNACIKLSALF